MGGSDKDEKDLEDGSETEAIEPPSWDKWKQSRKAKEFAMYCLFCFVFSFSAFMSKPGTVQFYLTEAAVGRFANCDTGVFCKWSDEPGMYQYLEEVMVDILFPQQDIQGVPLSELDRLFIQGQARVMGAMRIRQVRSKLVACDSIPAWLQEVGPYEVKCTTEYDSSTAETAPYGDPGQLLNFTLPFTYRSADELNSTNIAAMSGYYGPTYPQDGYAHDFIPNLSPRWFAEKVQACMPLMQASIENCRLEQQVDYDLILSPPPPPPVQEVLSPPPLQLGTAETAGMVLSDENSEAFIGLLSHEFLLSADNPTAEYEFKLHNPADTVTLNWEIDQNAIDQVPWIASVTPNTGFPVPASPDCTVDPNLCPGQRFVIQVQEDDWMRSQTNNNPTTSRTVLHETPVFDLVFTSPDTSSLRVTVSLTMIYNVAPNTGFRRRLEQASEDDEEEEIVPTENCVEKKELKEGVFAQENLKVPSALNLSKCNMVADINFECEVEHIGFQTLFELMQDNRCGQCKCEDALNPTCLQSCSPRDLYLQQVAFLRDQRWGDDQTRAFFLDTALFFQTDNLFQTVRVYWESHYSIGAKSYSANYPNFKIQTFKLYRYVSGFDFIVLAFEFLMFLMALGFTGIEIKQMWQWRFAYLKDPWNYVEWANVIIIYVVLILRVTQIMIISQFDYDSLSSMYIDFVPIGYLAQQELNVASVNFFLMYFKLFKYLTEVPRMNAILLTMASCAFDICLFTCMFMVVMFGFTAAFYIVFGADLSTCKTLSDTFGMLMRSLLGDFDYDAFKHSNPTMTPFLFYMFNILVMMILLNMFLAIVGDAYAEVKGEQSEEDLLYYIGLKNKIMARVNGLFKKKEAVRDMAASLLAGDTNLDDILDMEELETIFANNPEALKILHMEGAGELMKKYDVNGDGVIDKDELVQILKDLSEKQAEIQKEIDGEEEKEKGNHVQDIGHGGHGHRRHHGGGINARSHDDHHAVGLADVARLETRINELDKKMDEMSRNTAKKLSLMIDLMMSLSDQVSSVNVPNEVVDQHSRINVNRRGSSTALMPVLR